MTKNRASKQATRQRAALTGERYVVAQRAVDIAPHRTSRMHELLHRIPGLPPHIEGGLQAAQSRHRRATRPLSHHGMNRQPRVLVGWQNWIANRFRVNNN